MKVLKEEKLETILPRFAINDDLIYQKHVEYEPDCFLYFYKNQKGQQYVLICRDFVQDELDAEKRILKKEMNINITKRIKTKKTQDYWLFVKGLDNYEYIFSLVKYE